MAFDSVPDIVLLPIELYQGIISQNTVIIKSETDKFLLFAEKYNKNVEIFAEL